MNRIRRIGLIITKVSLSVACFVIIVRVAFFDLFLIPSDSMMDLIKRGDIIIVNKTLYSGIFANLISFFGFTPNLKTNDIVVFRYESGDYVYRVKRCIAKPGEVVELHQGKVLINNELMVDPPTVRHIYKIWYNNYNILKDSLNRYNLQIANSSFKPTLNYFYTYITKSQKDDLLRSSLIDSISNVHLDANERNLISLPVGSARTGKMDDFGPIIVPYKGWKFQLNLLKLQHYYRTLFSFEGAVISIQSDGKFYRNGLQIETYEFKKNYYFVLGDNRDNSQDSRSIGFIPEDVVTGIVIKIFHQ